MSNAKIHLKDYDTVVAVTQQAINETMASYLYNLKKNVALYYTTNKKGYFVPVKDEADAIYVFKGVLDYTLDAKGNPVDMVELYVPAEHQMVYYNVTFKGARFYSDKYHFDFKQSEGTEPWIIKFTVNLALQDTRLDKLPVEIREKVKKYVKNLGPGMFSIQQLVVDLNTAVFDKFKNITGMPDVPASTFSFIMKDYVKRQKEQGEILFGYGVKHTAKNNAPAPTFMPTSLNFCVTKYDNKGRNNSKLDTLNYLVMTDNHTPPRDIPNKFDFNWVKDESNQGVIAVKRDLFLPYVLDELSLILKTLCPKLAVNAKKKSITLEPGENHKFPGISSTPDPKVISEYKYKTGKIKDKYNPPPPVIDTFKKVWADYEMTCTISLKDTNTIHISGAITVSSEFTSISPSIHAREKKSILPKTTFKWSIDLELQMNLTTARNGELDLVSKNPDFDSKPVIEKGSETVWQRIFDAFLNITKKYATDLFSIRDKIKADIVDRILGVLNDGLTSANAFIFPGGKTFAFKQPMFSDSQDLTSTITYLLPTNKGGKNEQN